MTAVVVRRIESRLERMVRAGAGGQKIRDALAAADANLALIDEECRAELDRRLAPLLAFTARPPAVRPETSELQALAQEAEAALTACGGLALPSLGKTLVIVCAMADALANTDYWPAGALNPALNLVALFRSGSVSDEDSAALLSELARCLDRFNAHQVAD